MKIIFIQALIATLGSLYYGWYGDPVQNIVTGDLFNPDNGYLVCNLCRYARILMYPLVILSLVALIKKSKHIVNYILVVCSLGILLELYHYSLQKINIVTSTACTRGNPCAASQVNYFGFITIPFLALMAFVIIFVVAIVLRRGK